MWLVIYKTKKKNKNNMWLNKDIKSQQIISNIIIVTVFREPLQDEKINYLFLINHIGYKNVISAYRSCCITKVVRIIEIPHKYCDNNNKYNCYL